MFYGGVCHFCNLEMDYGAGCLTCGSGLDLIEKKSPNSFNIDQKKAIKIISGDINNSLPFGSFIFRAQYFPGDIDVIELVNVCDSNKVCKSKKDLINKVWRYLIDIIQRADSNKHYYFSEAKIGFDHRFLFTASDSQFINKVNSLYQNKLLDIKEFDSLIRLHKHLNKDNIDTINEFLRMKYTLRWTKDEILNGYKYLIGNKTIYILNALDDFAPIKIDLFIPINGNFIETTNFFVLFDYKNGKQHFLNINFDYVKSIIEQLMKFSSNLFFKPFKYAKRLWALSRYLEDRKYLNLLTPFLQSNYARIYQISSELDTLILMFQRIKHYPLQLMLRQIDNFKSRLSFIYDIKFDEKYIYDLIDVVVNDFSNIGIDKAINILTTIKKYLDKIISDAAVKFLTSHKLLPIPNKILKLIK
jgi:hypothetical protein